MLRRTRFADWHPILVLGFTLLAGVMPRQAQAGPYPLRRHRPGIDLGPDDGRSSQALGINDSGLIVGTTKTAHGVLHPFLFTPGGTDGDPSNPQMKDLGTLNGFDLDLEAHGIGINNKIQVYGYSFNTAADGSPITEASVWDSVNAMKRLPPYDPSDTRPTLTRQAVTPTVGRPQSTIVVWSSAIPPPRAQSYAPHHLERDGPPITTAPAVIHGFTNQGQ